MPFDEPVMGLIGMWNWGGGANPHSALALGRIMESAGQREIAWNAYERAVELSERFSPVTAVREQMVALCRERQGKIALSVAAKDRAAWEEKTRKRHVAELAWGQAYQRDYQAWEAKQIEAGVPLKAPDFYTAFFKDRKPIASDPGMADDVLITFTGPQHGLDYLPPLVLGAGLAMFLGTLGRRVPEPVASERAIML
jgi:hypothetical protein